MEELTDLLEKLSVEDIEKLRLLISLNPDAKTNEVITLRVFIEEYKVHIKNNRSYSYYKSVKTALNYLTEFYGLQKAISTISLKDIESFLIFLRQKVKTKSCSKRKTGEGYVVYFRNLKAAFNKAKDWGYIKENYFTKIKLPKKQRVQPAFINSSQLSAISNQIKTSIVRDVVVFGFYTGMRLNEIVNLKWKNINLITRIITVGDEEFTTKGKNQRFIPICDEALTSVLSQKERKRKMPIGDSYVFCKSNGERYNGDYLSKKFRQACRAAGINEAIHFHSLRHSFASNLVQQGVSLYVIKELLGHSSVSTTEIYSHLNVDTLREAIRVLDDPESFSNRNNDLQSKTYLSKIEYGKDLGKRQTSSQKRDINKRKNTPGLKIIVTKGISGG